MPCPAPPCGAAVTCRAVRCGAVACCVELRVVLYLLFRACQISFEDVLCSSTEVHRTKFVRTRLLNPKECIPRRAQLSYSSEARRATPCTSVRCRALPGGAVLCRAALCFLSNTPQYQVSCEIPGTRYRYVRVCSSSCFLN